MTSPQSYNELPFGSEDEYENNSKEECMIHLRVLGMMCQKNCGNTIRQALLDIPGSISASATYSKSLASATINIREYESTTHLSKKEEEVLTTQSDLDEESYMAIRKRIEEECVETIEDIGFDASILEIPIELRPDNGPQTQSDASNLRDEFDEGKKDNNDSQKSQEDTHEIIGTATFQILGMSCAVCTGRVERLLLQCPGVKTARVSLPTNRAKVQFVQDSSSPSSYAGQVEETAFIRGGENVNKEADLNPRSLAEECARVVTDGGYKCEIVDVLCGGNGNGNEGNNDDNNCISLADNASKMEEARKAELRSWRRLLIFSTAFTIPLIALHYSIMVDHRKQGHTHMSEYTWPGVKEWIVPFLATPVQFGVGKRFYIAAYKSFTNGRVIGMDFLVCLGTTAAYLYSIIAFTIQLFASSNSNNTNQDQNDDIFHPYKDKHDTHLLKPTFETGAMLLTFVTLGKFLESYAKGKTASALQKLMELQPVIASRVTNLPSQPQQPQPQQSQLQQSQLDDYNLNHINLHNLTTEEIEIKDVRFGDYLLVIPGARIPTDGVLVLGTSNRQNSKMKNNAHTNNMNNPTSCYIDESALTGEPFPISKVPGDTVYGSTVNQFSLLLIRVTATGTQTMLARIVRLIEDAQSNHAPIQDMADQIASIFAPTVMILSALTFFVWIILEHSDYISERFFVALMSAISVIVVACPCALGLATPTACMVGTGVGAKNGLLIKGGAVLEGAHSVGTVVFDKTGTLTTGRAVLGERFEFLSKRDTVDDDNNDNNDDSGSSDYDSHKSTYVDLETKLCTNLPNGITKNNLALFFAACAEAHSEHPLGSAIVNHAKTVFGPDFCKVEDDVVISEFAVIPGCGVETLVQKEGWGSWRVRVGKRSFAKESIHPRLTRKQENQGPDDIEVSKLRKNGHIGVYVSILDENTNEHTSRSEERFIIGVLGIVDSIKSDARSTVNALKCMNIDVWMCTGDHEVTALSVAKDVGIDPENVCANVSPEGKADLITRLQKARVGNGKLTLQNNGGLVAVVGDGINDSIALARADVGIAIGAGTEIAVEAADIVLVRSNLHDIVVALHLSRVVFNRIKLNFMWAMGYNLFSIPFAAGVLYPFTDWRIPPAFAGFMMAFSSVSVVTSSLLLNTYSKPIINDDGSLHNSSLCSFQEEMISRIALLCGCCCIKSQKETRRIDQTVSNLV